MKAHMVQDEDSVTMVALKPIKAGEQIFNDFGELPRSDLLRRYGYVTDNYKKWDVVELPLSLIVEVIEKDSQLSGKEKDQRVSRSATSLILGCVIKRIIVGARR